MSNFFKRAGHFENVGIRGEISEINRSQYRTFFKLKDENGLLECSAPSFKAERFPQLAHGTEIVAYGAIRVNERRSQYYLDVERVELHGIGALYQQYEALKSRFRAEGLFDAARKRALPRFPSIVALISARGKGAEDFERVLADKAPHVAVRFIETRVQGIGAEAEIAEAFDRAVRSDAQVIVLARGGGSYEDLFTFNQEPVVRAIVRSRLPVITGIGHKGDHHLADDVADVACITPSVAAEYLGNIWQSARTKLRQAQVALDREARHLVARASSRADMLDRSLRAAVERAISGRAERLRSVERRLDARSPDARLRAARERLTALHARLDAARAAIFTARERALAQRAMRIDPAMTQTLAAKRHRMQLLEGRLDAHDPNKAVAGGYAILTANGRVVTDAAQVREGDRIEARLAHGSLDAIVERVRTDE